MSMVPLGPLSSVAGSQLAQTKGTEAERSTQESTRQLNTDKSLDQAEKAAGLGATEEEQAASDRDPDGRRIREEQERSAENSDDEPSADANASGNRQSRDATGLRGNQLDLSG